MKSLDSRLRGNDGQRDQVNSDCGTPEKLVFEVLSRGAGVYLQPGSIFAGEFLLLLILTLALYHCYCIS